jgi:hypothetical protein
MGKRSIEEAANVRNYVEVFILFRSVVHDHDGRLCLRHNMRHSRILPKSPHVICENDTEQGARCNRRLGRID